MITITEALKIFELNSSYSMRDLSFAYIKHKRETHKALEEAGIQDITMHSDMIHLEDAYQCLKDAISLNAQTSILPETLYPKFLPEPYPRYKQVPDCTIVDDTVQLEIFPVSFGKDKVGVVKNFKGILNKCLYTALFYHNTGTFISHVTKDSKDTMSNKRSKDDQISKDSKDNKKSKNTESAKSTIPAQESTNAAW